MIEETPTNDITENNNVPEEIPQTDESQEPQNFENAPLSEEDVEISNPITVNMACPQAKVGTLIGKKGVIVQEIMKRSGCKIHVDQLYPEGHPRQIQLTGNPKGLSIAMALVSQVMEHGPSIILPPPKNLVREVLNTGEDFLCPHQKVGTVIGHKGSNVNEILRRTGCKIQVIQEGVPDGVDRKVTFSGNPQQVAAAKILVTNIIKQGASALSSGTAGYGSMIGPPDGHGFPDGLIGNSVIPPGGPTNGFTLTQEEDINPQKVRSVIGAKGSVIGEVMRRSGCKIVINQKFPEGMPHKVIYTGTQHEIELAKYFVDVINNYGINALFNIFSTNSNIVAHSVRIFINQAAALLSPHGLSINEIQARCGVKLNLDTTPLMDITSGYSEPMNKLTVIGAPDNIQEALKMVQQATSGGGPPSTTPHGIPTLHGNGSVEYPTSGASYNALQGYGMSQVQMNGFNMMTGEPQPGTGVIIPGGGPVNINPNANPNPSTASNENAGKVMGLGADGSAGRLEVAMPVQDGLYQQVAVIKNDLVGRVVGARSATITLIKSKSGVTATVDKLEGGIGPNQSMTRIVLLGTQQSVVLAAQMVQEVLVNGTAKLLKMPDVPCSVPAASTPIPASAPASGAPAPTGQSYALKAAMPPASSALNGNNGLGGIDLNNKAYLSSSQPQHMGSLLDTPITMNGYNNQNSNQQNQQNSMSMQQPLLYQQQQAAAAAGGQPSQAGGQQSFSLYDGPQGQPPQSQQYGNMSTSSGNSTSSVPPNGGFGQSPQFPPLGLPY